MTGSVRLRRLFYGMTAAALMASCGAQAADLPKKLVVTAYDFGSAGYSQVSALAELFLKKFDTTIRILPSRTSVGRVLPIAQRRAQYGFLAMEAYFAAEGAYDFSNASWGPQDLRIVLAPPVVVGLTVPKGSRFAESGNLKGIRLGYVKNNPSLNVKTDALLAFAGLTREDVTPVWFDDYGEMKAARLAGTIDGFLMSPYSSVARALAASPDGIDWISFNPGDTDGWRRMRRVAPMYAPTRADNGFGMKKDQVVDIIQFRYPLMVTYADRSAAEVYQVTKALAEAFMSLDADNPMTARWSPASAGRPPADVAWHPGAIEYLREKGIWTDADEAWNKKRLARHAAVRQAWEDATDAFNKWRAAELKKNNAVSVAQAWPNYWTEYRRKIGLD